MLFFRGRRGGRVLLLLGLCSLLWIACDEELSAVGGQPGGDPNGFWDSLMVTRATAFPVEQHLRYADLQFTGNLPAHGLQAQMIVHFEYQLPDTISLIPDTVSVDSIVFSMRMDKDSSRVLFGPDIDNEFPSRQLDFLLIEDPLDGDEVQDSLLWEDLNGDGAPQVLDSARFEFLQQERLWGDEDGELNVDPEGGIFSTRGLGEHEWWFASDSLATLVPDSSPPRYRRTLLIRMADGEEGMLAWLAQGWNNSLRPGYRLYFQDYWIDEQLGLQDSTNWAFQSSLWQNGVVLDENPGDGLTLNATGAWQVLLELPPFQPMIDNTLLRPATASLLKAYLRLPILERSFNSGNGILHMYGVDSYDPETLDLNDAQYEFRLYSSETLLEEEVEEQVEIEFSVVNYLVQHWTERSDFNAEDSLRIALRYSPSDLELRRLRLVEPLSGDSLQPRLVFKMTESPEPWGQP